MSRDPTCVFDVDPELLRSIGASLGPPVDGYVVGWQVWLASAPGGTELEYRLHPPGGFRMPEGVHPEELWDLVMAQLHRADRLGLGGEERRLDEVWVLLEVYPAQGDPVSPEELRSWAEAALGRPARAAGHVDHALLGKRWERRPGRFDLAAALLEELESQRDV